MLGQECSDILIFRKLFKECTYLKPQVSGCLFKCVLKRKCDLVSYQNLQGARCISIAFEDWCVTVYIGTGMKVGISFDARK